MIYLYRWIGKTPMYWWLFLPRGHTLYFRKFGWVEKVSGGKKIYDILQNAIVIHWHKGTNYSSEVAVNTSNIINILPGGPPPNRPTEEFDPPPPPNRPPEEFDPPTPLNKPPPPPAVVGLGWLKRPPTGALVPPNVLYRAVMSSGVALYFLQICRGTNGFIEWYDIADKGK